MVHLNRIILTVTLTIVTFLSVKNKVPTGLFIFFINFFRMNQILHYRNILTVQLFYLGNQSFFFRSSYKGAYPLKIGLDVFFNLQKLMVKVFISGNYIFFFKSHLRKRIIS